MKHQILCPCCSEHITVETNITITSRATFPEALGKTGMSLDEIRKKFILPEEDGIVRPIKRLREIFKQLSLIEAKHIIEAAIGETR